MASSARRPRPGTAGWRRPSEPGVTDVSPGIGKDALPGALRAIATREAYMAALTASGRDLWNSTGLTYFSTMARLPGVPSCLKRKSTLAAWEARIASLVGRSQSWRLNGPIAFLRAV